MYLFTKNSDNFTIDFVRISERCRVEKKDKLIPYSKIYDKDIEISLSVAKWKCDGFSNNILLTNLINISCYARTQKQLILIRLQYNPFMKQQ